MPRTQFFSTCSSFIQAPRLLNVWLSSLLQTEISESSTSKGGWGRPGGRHGHRCAHSPVATPQWLSSQRSAPSLLAAIAGCDPLCWDRHPVALQWQGWVAQPPLRRATAAPCRSMPAGSWDNRRRSRLKTWIWYLKSFSDTRRDTMQTQLRRWGWEQGPPIALRESFPRANSSHFCAARASCCVVPHPQGHPQRLS